MATTDKYDRQLRLWGSTGQKNLMSTKLLLLNAGPTGSEILKNLVLPGVGSFEICDHHIVNETDLGNNFFVTKSDLNRSRAQVVMEWMLEMNPDVKGNFNTRSPESIIESDESYIRGFNLVVATQITEPSLSKLAVFCFNNSIPLLILHAFGTFGYCRLQVPEHTIVDSKPDSLSHDLRLAAPFPELLEFANSFDLSDMDSLQHAHVPFVVILIQSINEWKALHDGSLPKNFAEKEQFKATIKSKCHGPFGQELNFQEAVDNAYKAYVLPQVPDDVHDVLTRATSKTLTASSASFWVIARAVGDFVKEKGCLPLSGQVPDMTALTQHYVALQKIYIEKARQDFLNVLGKVQKLLQEIGSSKSSISEEEIAEFCKNSSYVRVLDTRSLADEWSKPSLVDVDIEEENPMQSPLIWYFLFRAAQMYISEHGKYPGIHSDDTSEVAWLVTKARELILQSSNGQELHDWVTEEHGKEICRHFEAELHNISSILGGIGAQEAVKIITHQFMPMSHTYIFNGITGCAGTYNL